MKRFLLLSLLLLTLLSGCNQKNAVITVLHTNDYHGKTFDDAGLAERASYIKQVRSDNKNVLLLDAGDINARGKGVSIFTDWGIDIAAYNLMNYDALVFGNHEFDRDISILEEQMNMAVFPFLAANIKRSDGTYLGKPWIVKQYDGVRVGIFGITTTEKNFYKHIQGIEFFDEVESAKEVVAQLREKEKCDIIIALVHLGIGENTHGGTFRFAESVPGIDLIIDGHSETFIEEPLIINNVPVITAKNYGAYIGETQLTIKKGKITKLDWKLVAIDDSLPVEPAIDLILAPRKAEIEAFLNEAIATATDDFEQDFKESLNKETAAGNLVNDSTVWYIRNILNKQVDFAFTNGATLREGPRKGEITNKNLYELLPFENNIIIVEMKGSDLANLFDYIASLPLGDRGWAQVSSDVRYTIDYTGEEGKVKNLKIGGKGIEPDATYFVATNDYITRGGNRYDLQGIHADTDVNLRTALIEYIKHLKTVTPVIDGRITIIGM